jgi:hypothetical protein
MIPGNDKKKLTIKKIGQEDLSIKSPLKEEVIIKGIALIEEKKAY